MQNQNAFKYVANCMLKIVQCTSHKDLQQQFQEHQWKNKNCYIECGTEPIELQHVLSSEQIKQFYFIRNTFDVTILFILF